MAPTKRSASSKQTGGKRQKTSANSKKKALVVRVDKAFKDAAKAEVFIDSTGTIWDANLTLSNVSGNNNKFYLIQLLKNGKKYFVHTRWGRVGEAGQHKTAEHSTLDDGKEDFEKKFKDKSGLAWSDRSSKPKDNKYTFIEKSYDGDDDDDDDSKSAGDEVESELELPVLRLMELIFKYNLLPTLGLKC